MEGLARLPIGSHYTLFDTVVGKFGAAWGEYGILTVDLLDQSGDEGRIRDAQRSTVAVQATPPAEIQFAIDGIVRHLGGEPMDLSGIVLDMTGMPPFHQKVYKAARKIPPGRTASYRDLAVQAGSPLASRAVGQALSRNPFLIIVPCHRVLSATGNIGGFSAVGGTDTKMSLLMIERGMSGVTPQLR